MHDRLTGSDAQTAFIPNTWNCINTHQPRPMTLLWKGLAPKANGVDKVESAAVVTYSDFTKKNTSQMLSGLLSSNSKTTKTRLNATSPCPFTPSTPLSTNIAPCRRENETNSSSFFLLLLRLAHYRHHLSWRVNGWWNFNFNTNIININTIHWRVSLSFLPPLRRLCESRR